MVTQWSLRTTTKTGNPNKYKGSQAFLTITPGIDLQTGELITENLHLYFNKKFHTNFKLEEMF